MVSSLRSLAGILLIVFSNHLSLSLSVHPGQRRKIGVGEAENPTEKQKNPSAGRIRLTLPRRESRVTVADFPAASAPSPEQARRQQPSISAITGRRRAPLSPHVKSRPVKFCRILPSPAKPPAPHLVPVESAHSPVRRCWQRILDVTACTDYLMICSQGPTRPGICQFGRQYIVQPSMRRIATMKRP